MRGYSLVATVNRSITMVLDGTGEYKEDYSIL
jgi:hypothetical protein